MASDFERGFLRGRELIRTEGRLVTRNRVDTALDNDGDFARGVLAALEVAERPSKRAEVLLKVVDECERFIDAVAQSHPELRKPLQELREAKARWMQNEV